MNNPIIVLYDPELTKEFYSKTNQYWRKELETLGIFLDLVGNTFGNQEGDAHKKRRAIISKIFNFDFLRRIIP